MALNLELTDTPFNCRFFINGFAVCFNIFVLLFFCISVPLNDCCESQLKKSKQKLKDTYNIPGTLIEHSHAKFAYNMYNIYKSCIKLFNQYTRRCVNKLDKTCNGNFLTPSLSFLIHLNP